MVCVPLSVTVEPVFIVMLVMVAVPLLVNDIPLPKVTDAGNVIDPPELLVRVPLLKLAELTVIVPELDITPPPTVTAALNVP
jgi:hypothetical protein